MPRGMGPGRNAFMSDEEKENIPKVTPELLKRVFSYLKPYVGQLAVVMGAILISSYLGLLPSVLTGRILDEGLIAGNLGMLVKLILLSLLVTFGSNLIGMVQSYFNTWIAQHITFDMRNQMFKHLQKMSQRFFTSNNQGDIITRMTGDIGGVQMVITNTFTGILSNLMTLVLALITMFSKNRVLALLGIAVVPLFVIPTRIAGKKRWTLTREAQECNDTVNGILNETLSVSGQMLVKLFGREEAEYQKYYRANEKMTSLNVRESMAGRWFFVIINTFSSIGPMLLYLVGGILMIRYDSTLTVGDVTVMVALLGRMYGPVNSLLNMQVEWMRAMAMFSRIFEYLDMPVEIENKENAIIPKETDGSVRFDHVSFAYDEDRPILKNVSFELRAGHSVAIVGPSGAGKSSIINLIPRFFDVTNGSVSFGGIDVRDLDLKYLRAHIGVVTQDTYLFNGTIRDNLLYAKPDATQEELENACRKANIHDFITAQADGYLTMVGNRGLKLSGGEKQRISIARVLLKNPELFIFDEATASLDSISESKIQEAIDPLITSRTSILIAHRLSTILAADEILVVKDGEIVERGRHADLVKMGGVYTELYDTQFAKAAEMERKEMERQLSLQTE